MDVHYIIPNSIDRPQGNRKPAVIRYGRVFTKNKPFYWQKHGVALEALAAVNQPLVSSSSRQSFSLAARLLRLLLLIEFISMSPSPQPPPAPADAKRTPDMGQVYTKFWSTNEKITVQLFELDLFA